MATIMSEYVVQMAKEFVNFMNQAITPFHVVQTVAEMLKDAGYTQLHEEKAWPEITPGGKYYLMRNGTSIIAFSVGGKFDPMNGVKIVGAHTDSPNFLLKPRTKSTAADYQRVAVQCYGGGLWHSWFDRDLTVAGRVMISRERLEQKIIKIDKPIMRIPNLAIHLTSAKDREAFSPNKESHLIPIISTQIAAKIAECDDKDASNPNHCVSLMKAIASVAGCSADEIVDFDLSVIDTQPAVIGGIHDEFIFSPRLDNLISCYCAVKAIVEAGSLENDTMMRMVCLFDHEECGSSSSQGAAGSLVPDVIEHIVSNKTLRATLVANSFLLSVDGAHGCHPNYADKHENAHRPALHGGPVIKYNANVRYATNGLTAAVVKDMAKKADIPIQEFVVRNDSPCGSTIGPILSSLSGIKTADIGNPMISMHSIREMCGTVDVYYLTKLIESFFVNYQSPHE
ncbi:aspartyl aminopeptidase [Leishmania donovani]|uniref:aspartyl aminopeptidase n=3 Tax=Leishmania donovani species complex TaxID=38574 RepID=A0A6L0XVB8_LEIIN|nr:metallo-peptidase, Clan MH, Family M20 [Leishmania infantum JPCM5]CAC9510209.1 aspartyl_aminopeptidase_-_putative [Leishmania infantum]CAJ1990729.1 aspartyl aminopeptidase [Leishmania donovani]CAM69816.1 metallo-peptidase, Clan MH, Family M20 [Leishmania infantum JPCM5]SUZ43759.1 aspartyl_aminopeptidase_-_putative [Leishmania infantum]VDZ46580.1 aspartyl_aminopeptidase_putative/GeneDB:LmjF.29.2360 [Leishmania donovani]|eukprot:XP_001466769.1 metallo-peptidase, Clan MH, Family M20 [Leishmania infantum JPCM5]